MRTAENDGVRPFCRDVGKIFARDQLGYAVVGCGITVFNKRHKHRTGTRQNTQRLILFTQRTLERAAFDRRRRTEDGHLAAAGLRDCVRAVDRALDHTHDRHIQPLGQQAERVGGCGPAGDKNSLDGLGHQEMRVLQRILSDGFHSARTVWQPRRIPEINIAFSRQDPLELVCGGQTAHTRIEYADRLFSGGTHLRQAGR